jgi:hydrogenase maturation protease
MTSPPRILVAGVGNVFRGDDAFGCEVVRRLAGRARPPGVRVVDVGTRGRELAYLLLDGYECAVLVDATARGGEPGTLYVLEPTPGEPDPRPHDGHGATLPAVFDLVRQLGGTLPPLYLVGCEPADLGTDDEGAMGLSEPVENAVEEAVRLVESLIAVVRAGRVSDELNSGSVAHASGPDADSERASQLATGGEP